MYKKTAVIVCMCGVSILVKVLTQAAVTPEYQMYDIIPSYIILTALAQIMSGVSQTAAIEFNIKYLIRIPNRRADGLYHVNKKLTFTFD